MRLLYNFSVTSKATPKSDTLSPRRMPLAAAFDFWLLLREKVPHCNYSLLASRAYRAIADSAIAMPISFLHARINKQQKLPRWYREDRLIGLIGQAWYQNISWFYFIGWLLLITTLTRYNTNTEDDDWWCGVAYKYWILRFARRRLSALLSHWYFSFNLWSGPRPLPMRFCNYRCWHGYGVKINFLLAPAIWAHRDAAIFAFEKLIPLFLCRRYSRRLIHSWSAYEIVDFLKYVR